MKEETKNIIIVIIYLVCLTSICWTTWSGISNVNKKVDSIVDLTRYSTIKQLQETCHNQGGIYWESKNTTSATCFKDILPHQTRAEFECPEDSQKITGLAVTAKDEATAKKRLAILEEQRDQCRKWKEARDIVRKKNYKEYACKTLDTFEDYLACNEK